MQISNSPAYWDELKTKLRRRYPELSAVHFQHREGGEESMLRLIEYKLRMSKEKMQEIIKTL